MKKVDIGLIDTLILCGGKGTRLQTVVPDKPKILADIGGSPFIEYLLNYLEKEGIKRIILCTGYKHNQIKEWVRSSYHGELDILFSREKKIMGTGGAIKNAEKFIKSDLFIVLNGDSYCKIDYQKFTQNHLRNNALITIVVSEIKDTSEYGSIFFNKENKVFDFVEKQSIDEGNHINAGIYCIEKRGLNLMPSRESFSIEKDFFPSLVENDMYAYKSNSEFIDIGTPKNLRMAKFILGKHNFSIKTSILSDLN